MKKPIKTIVDCDPGIDDAIALMVAGKLTQLQAITTVAGNVALEHTTRNALGLCNLLGLDVPVCPGADTSMSEDQPDASHVHGENGLADISLPLDDQVVSSQNAVECLLSMSDDQVWVVAIGPLTNIAQAVLTDPNWSERVAGLCLMGGSASGGNATAAAEFNILRDYEAAKIVFESGLPITMCGLNLTNRLWVNRDDLERLGTDTTPHIVPPFAKKILGFCLDRICDITNSSTMSLHDPCAILAITHPEHFSFNERPVYIETKGEVTAGMTVVDERNIRAFPSDTKRVRVGYDLDREILKQLIFDTILSY